MLHFVIFVESRSPVWSHFVLFLQKLLLGVNYNKDLAYLLCNQLMPVSESVLSSIHK